jgi:hypothetical protein
MHSKLRLSRFSDEHAYKQILAARRSLGLKMQQTAGLHGHHCRQQPQQQPSLV